MSTTDARGKYRLGMFEEMTDAITGKKYRTQSGIGKTLNMQADGEPFTTHAVPMSRFCNRGPMSPLAMQLRMDASTPDDFMDMAIPTAATATTATATATTVRDYAGGSLVTRSKTVEIYKKPTRKTAKK